jgi:hypothetical protein
VVDFSLGPAAERSWAAWVLIAGVPALWAAKAGALVFNARGRIAISSIARPESWRLIGLARLPIAVGLTVLVLLA